MIRCAKCARFTRNNIATVGFDQIKAAHGDCSRCGTGIEVTYESWEDWGWSDEDIQASEDRLIASLEGASTQTQETT